MVRAVAWPVAAAAALSAAAPVSAQSRLDIDLPAGPLGTAADRLARQAGLSIALGDPALAARRVDAVRGRMTAAAAVRALARGARATARRIGAAGWRLTPEAPQRRPPTPRPVANARVPAPAAPTQGDVVVVLASKRAVPLGALAGSVEVIETPSIGIDAGTAALVQGSTIISSTYRGAGREKLFIRGIADSSFSGRLQSVTGLYFGDVRMTYSAADPDLQLYDIASVEVLQGPQGTLYGAGSLGGIIRLNPVAPRRGVLAGAAGGGLSAVAHGATGGDADAVANVPLGDALALRVVGYAREEGGYIDKPAVGRDVNRTRIAGGRATLRWWPGDGWTVDAVAIGQTRRVRDNQYVTIGAPPLTSLTTDPEPFGGDYAAAHLVVNGRLGDATLTSATGIASQTFGERVSPADVASLNLQREHRLVTSETRLARTLDDGSGWVMGASFTRSVATITPFLDIDASGPRDLSIGDTMSELALFGEATVRITSLLSLGGGARMAGVHTTDSVAGIAGSEARRQRQVERWILPTASLVLHPARTLTIYARWQRSRRPSAILGEPGTSPAPSAILGEPGPETSKERIEGVDAGLRWRPGNGVRADVSLQHERWRSLQINVLEGFLTFIGGSVGDATIDSANVALRFPLAADFTIDLAATVNRTRLSAFGLGAIVPARKPALPDAANVIARVGLHWQRAIANDVILGVNGWARYEGVSSATIGPLTLGRQGDYVSSAATFSLERGRNRVSIAVDNLLDDRGRRYLLGQLTELGRATTLQRPLTVRIGLRRTF